MVREKGRGNESRFGEPEVWSADGIAPSVVDVEIVIHGGVLFPAHGNIHVCLLNRLHQGLSRKRLHEVRVAGLFQKVAGRFFFHPSRAYEYRKE
jgi:hypothetical protein